MIHFDCHAHVFENLVSIPGARYTPKQPAPLAAWKKNLTKHRLKGGVIVQVSFLGTDNSELCAALSKLDKSRFAGVGVVAIDVDEAELDRLISAGIRGFRWNLVRDGEVPDITSSEVQSFFAKLRQRNLHLEIHLEGPRLASHLGVLSDQGVNLVIDHFGLPSDSHPDADPFINAVKKQRDCSNLFVKFAAHYRSGFGLASHANALLDLLENGHIVWGSDWPHTQHENSVCYSETWDAVVQADSFSDAAAAKTLFGLTVSQSANHS
ncbi:MAG: amidohydrolase family protein, partial [Pseudomonadota bacterium]